MGQVIVMADQLRAYTLSDIGTFLFFRGRTDLAVLSHDEPQLANIYSVMRVNPKRHPQTQAALAVRFIDCCWPNERKKESANTACWAILCLFPPSNRASCGN